jgi:glycosyltransferase involved in cell wall biosynthesis
MSVTNQVLDLSRWAVVAYNDTTGLGRMAEDIKALLGLRHLVIPSERLETRPLNPASDTLLPRDASETEVASVLQELQGVVILEAPWNKELLAVARRLGVRVACVPMWEWFRGSDKDWSMVDRFLCPSDLCLKVVRSYGWNNSIHVPWTIDLSRLPTRAVRGPARVFFHNGGLMDHDDRKSTRDTILAFRRVRRRDVRLIVRLQKPADLGPLDDRVDVRIGNLEDVSSLYEEGDVAVQPSAMEGIGFMVLEPVCSGVPTITTNCPPVNDYVTQPELRTKTRWFARSAFPTRAARILHAHRRPPSIHDVTRRIEWCADHDLATISAENRMMAQRMFNPDVLRARWTHVLGGLM